MANDENDQQQPESVSQWQILWIKAVANAWKDPDFKQQLMTNPREALQKRFGVTLPESVKLKVERLGRPDPDTTALPGTQVEPPMEMVKPDERWCCRCPAPARQQGRPRPGAGFLDGVVPARRLLRESLLQLTPLGEPSRLSSFGHRPAAVLHPEEAGRVSQKNLPERLGGRRPSCRISSPATSGPWSGWGKSMPTAACHPRAAGGPGAGTARPAPR